MTNSFYLLLMFMFFFSPILNIYLPIHLGALAFVIIFFFYTIKIILGSYKIFGKFIIFLLLIFSFSLLSLFLNLIFGFHVDLVYFKSFISISSYIIFGMVFSLIFDKYKDIDDFLKVIFRYVKILIILNSMIIIFEVLNPNIRVFLENLFVKSNEENIDYLTRIDRYRGLSMGGGAGLSLFMSWGAALITYDYLLSKNFSKLIVTLLNLIIIFFSMIFVGRTGFIMYILFFLFLLICNLKNSVFKKFFVILPLIFIPFFLLDLGLIDDFIFKRAIGVFIFYDPDGDKTIFELFNSINIDDNLFSIIFGVGNSSGSFQNISYSDIGYMKLWTSVGLILSGVFYFVFFCEFWSLFKKSKKYKTLLHILLILFFVSEFKEPFIFKGPTARFMWFLLGALIRF